ncbi:hypothetical protein [Lederbergia citrea]|uniref:Uncharacterized protein n=1 Tax=Lederbergia citrea TaxID=2833581 RepID=A0A942URD1_9BACI|nr:hypothetical protein [Lederbergia citrea]MBS4177851.1 hypothetical protein [Lederbergia citrea]MBS4204525.1 hypothetical protein [Lederbergia citrea]MBS4223631.1 hypothetical protein [Lederbergia citrea]
MLTFEQKQAIIESFPQLTRKEVSLKRLNYHFEDSLFDKTVVVHHLHPNGNGFVYVGDLPQYNADNKGLVNIREASEEDLRKIIADSIKYLSDEESEEVREESPIEQEWRNQEGQSLILMHEDMLWNIYTGLNLEESFASQSEAEQYLREEGFRPYGA